MEKKSTFNRKKYTLIKKIIQSLKDEIEKRKIYCFKKELTVYYSNFHNAYYFKVCDEGKKRFCLIREKEVVDKNIIFSFFLKEEVLIDDISAESLYLSPEFIDSIIRHRVGNISVVDAYTQNLKRIDNLIKDQHYYAALILIVSAFENAVKKLFFENSSVWVFPSNEIFDYDLANKYGSLEKKEETMSTVYATDKIVYYFDHYNGNVFSSLVKIKHRMEIYQIVKKTGLFNEYFERLSCNNFEEVGLVEILRNLLEEGYRRSNLNFQKINGECGVKWTMKNFFSIDLNPIEKELKKLDEIFSIRHRVVHGYVQDSEIDPRIINESKEDLRKVLLYLDHEINYLYLCLD